jgi:hypothetical protein
MRSSLYLIAAILVLILLLFVVKLYLDLYADLVQELISNEYIPVTFLFRFNNFMLSMQVRNLNPTGPPQLWVSCSPGDPNAKEMTLDDMKSEELYDPPVIMVSI